MQRMKRPTPVNALAVDMLARAQRGEMLLGIDVYAQNPT